MQAEKERYTPSFTAEEMEKLKKVLEETKPSVTYYTPGAMMVTGCACHRCPHCCGCRCNYPWYYNVPYQWYINTYPSYTGSAACGSTSDGSSNV